MISDQARQSEKDTKKNLALRTGSRNVMKTRRVAKLAVDGGKRSETIGLEIPSLSGCVTMDGGSEKTLEQKVHVSVRVLANFPFCY
jgi:hypothetical protein